jgi:hypothetical protein
VRDDRCTELSRTIERLDLSGRQNGTVALSVCKIEAGLTGEAVDPSSPVAAADVGVRRVPVPA